jgi:hypothetical protein
MLKLVDTQHLKRTNIQPSHTTHAQASIWGPLRSSWGAVATAASAVSGTPGADSHPIDNPGVLACDDSDDVC